MSPHQKVTLVADYLSPVSQHQLDPDIGQVRIGDNQIRQHQMRVGWGRGPRGGEYRIRVQAERLVRIVDYLGCVTHVNMRRSPTGRPFQTGSTPHFPI